jgi:hypothetical protein
MSGVIDAETAAKLVKYMRENDEGSPHLQATFANFVWSMYAGDSGLDDIDLVDGEIEEILETLPTDPRQELEYMDESVLDLDDDARPTEN